MKVLLLCALVVVPRITPSSQIFVVPSSSRRPKTHNTIRNPRTQCHRNPQYGKERDRNLLYDHARRGSLLLFCCYCSSARVQKGEEEDKKYRN
ncbi:hypothetical protein L3Y34_009824 [Caenorhabditis briggsae]|uniref:Secreted protein n=1 Tax=Caenorhabditis briggsae TaxID=6238 RepID=A0AAE9D2D7_CAEBR|nr:hypothetical protein L3Y34_009824 [Caenorhabditis briggsae]